MFPLEEALAGPLSALEHQFHLLDVGCDQERLLSACLVHVSGASPGNPNFAEQAEEGMVSLEAEVIPARVSLIQRSAGMGWVGMGFSPLALSTAGAGPQFAWG